MKKKSPIDIYPIRRLPEKACWKATFLGFLEDIFQAISRSKRKVLPPVFQSRRKKTDLQTAALCDGNEKDLEIYTLYHQCSWQQESSV